MTDVLIMAGGLGLRLRPITNDMPKPMVEVGGRPIIERLVESFAAQGFTKIYISVNFRATDIEDHFGDGSAFGVDIRYVRETGASGTAGALSLLPDNIHWPLVVVNGDLILDVDFREMVKFHEQRRSSATMGVRKHLTTVPYGVVHAQGDVFLGVREKPADSVLVNVGVYVLSAEVLNHMPSGRLDMPDLFNHLLEPGRGTPFVFPVNGRWQDIATPDDLTHAQRFAHVR